MTKKGVGSLKKFPRDFSMPLKKALTPGSHPSLLREFLEHLFISKGLPNLSLLEASWYSGWEHRP